MRLARLFPGGEAVEAEELVASLDFASVAPEGRPHVAVNFVSSLDGRATVAGESAPLSGAPDRRMFHLLRTSADAVLAGTNTMRLERYGRMVRDPELRAMRERSGLGPDPWGILVSRSGDVPWEVPLFDAPEQRVAVYSGEPVKRPDTAAQVLLTRVSADNALAEALAHARSELGIRSVLCEGGPHVFGALLAGGLADELFLSLAPTLAGGGAETAMTAGPELPEPAQAGLEWVLEGEGTLFLRYAIGR